MTDGNDSDERGEATGRLARAAEALRRFDSHSRSVAAAKALRSMLPGDRDYGDPLSVGGNEPSQLLGQRLAAVTAERPSAMRAIGVRALPVWPAVSAAPGRGQGTSELAILVT